MKNLYQSTPNHQASFFRASIMQEHCYDETFRMLADFELFMHCLLRRNTSYVKMDFVVVDYLLGGFSTGHIELFHKEREKILRRYLPGKVLCDYEEMLHPQDRLSRMANYLKKNNSMTTIGGYLLFALTLPARLRNYIRIHLS